MLSRTLMLLGCLGLMAAGPAPAQSDIDPFTVAQGPITVGPGEEPGQDVSVLQTATVLGGFRVMVPVMDDEAPGGSSATATAGGGEVLCELDFAGASGDPGGGCALGYHNDGDPYFDFSGVSSIDFEVLEAAGPAGLSVMAVDAVDRGRNSLVDSLSPGPVSISRDSFISLVGEPEFDWSNIDSIVLTVASMDQGDVRVRLGGISTTGTIGEGDFDPDPGDDELADTVSGNFYNPERDGEGCQLTRQADNATFVMTCYIYQLGEQAWVIGTGVLDNGRIDFDDMELTHGADFGPGFDPDDVERIPFGPVSMTFDDCNHATISMDPEVSPFVPVDLDMERIVPVACDQGVPSPDNARRIGIWFDPLRDGEGFQLSVAGDGDTHILTWYTYLDGEQAWMIGSGEYANGMIEFGDVQVTRGTGFGPAFDPDDVERIDFGTITMGFVDCNNAVMDIDSQLPAFESMELELTRIVSGACQ